MFIWLTFSLPIESFEVMDQILVSDSNRTPLVQIVTWLCVVTSVLAFFTNVGIKIYISRSLSAESGLVFTSLVGFLYCPHRYYCN